MNTAGGGAAADPDDPDDDHWRRMLDVNLLGVVRASARPAATASAASGASVVTIGSINGR